MDFTFVGGHAGLDLVATRRYRRGPVEVELLAAPHDFARWCQEAELLTAQPSVSAADLSAALELREVGYRLALAASRSLDSGASDRRILNELAASPPIQLALGSGNRLVATGTSAQVVTTVARRFITLLGSPSRALIRQCDGSECTRFFVDRSRAHNRRFCSDQLCGNREKVAAFRRRNVMSSPRTP